MSKIIQLSKHFPTFFGFLKSRIQYLIFAMILLAGIFIRHQFLVDFPYFFGHPDSDQYVNSIRLLLNEQPFIPSIIRVNGTYVYFVFFIFEFLGSRAFNVLLVQTMLGLISGIMIFFIIKKLTRSFLLANLGFFSAILLPRGLFYEHIILGDSLNSSLIIGFALVALYFHQRANWLLSLILGSLSVLLILGRGQGIISIIVALPLMINSIFKGKIIVGVSALVLFFLPIVILTSWYKQVNVKYNHFNGLSAAGNYNLFWIGSSRFIDFDSDVNKEVKSALKPFILKTNSTYDGDESWGVKWIESRGNLLPELGFLGSDWQEINRVLGEVAWESIITHPLAFTYRVYWNIYDFFWNKTSLFKTIDLSDLLLRKTTGEYFVIDSQKVIYSRTLNSLESKNIQSANANLVENYFLTRGSKSTERTLTERIVNKLSWFTNFRLFTFGIYFSVFVYLFNRVRNTIHYFLLLALLLGQVILTVIASNALYDRYFIPVEPLAIVIICIAISSFINLSLYDKIKTVIFVIIFPGLVTILLKTFMFLPLRFPVVDKPILGLSQDIVINNQQLTVSITLVVISSILTLLLMTKLFYLFQIRYGK